ncbi:MAG: hypothetical protein V1928_04815 [Parcubacteria group bacterium]
MKTLKQAVMIVIAVGGILLIIGYGIVNPPLNKKEALKINLEAVPRIDISQVKKAVEFNPHHLEITELKPLQIIEVNMEGSGEQNECYLKEWPSSNRCIDWVNAVVRQIEEKYKNQFEIKIEYSGGGMYDKHWDTKATMMFYPKQKKY